MCELTELQTLSEAQLIEMNQSLAVDQEAIRAKRVAIVDEIRAREARLAEARAHVARLEAGDAVVAGQVLEASAGVN
jgi:hypothetical protein